MLTAFLFSEKSNDIQDDREQDTQQDANNDGSDYGEINTVILASEMDVAGEPAHPGYLRDDEDNQPNHKEDRPKNHERLCYQMTRFHMYSGLKTFYMIFDIFQQFPVKLLVGSGHA
jgi:hypothetical protein